MSDDPNPRLALLSALRSEPVDILRLERALKARGYMIAPIPPAPSEADVERVARAIAGLAPEAFRGLGVYQQEDYRRAARRTLSAITPTASAETRGEVIEACADLCDDWIRQFGDVQIIATSARDYAVDAVEDIAEAMRALKEPSHD